MAAYGLYTHIASNRFRSMLLLAGLFLLIYVLVYAGALIAEVVINSDASVDYYLVRASRDLIAAFPYATGAAALWIVIAFAAPAAEGSSVGYNAKAAPPSMHTMNPQEDRKAFRSSPARPK